MTTHNTRTTSSVQETESLGEKIGGALQSGDLVCLVGALGAGKTALTRGIARGWGSSDPVTSPTFTLVNEYRHPDTAIRLYHIDCYRLADGVEAWTIGLEDILDGTSIVVIEWPDRILDSLPPDRLWVELRAPSDEGREFSFDPQGEVASRLMDRLSL